MRRVFLAWRNPLFHDAVRLLLQHPRVELVGEEVDHEEWLDAMLESQPDVVVMEHSSHLDPSLEDALLSLPPETKLIRFGFDDNRMQIYQRREQTVAEAEELLDLILSNDIDSERADA